ncbi:hypothetical protein BW687_022870 [Pseudomonas graminis]|jgi:hypothetical protein|uniref:Uncharacterized protein n=1 Tax=Pseudomonas graminis TaxID=158627 RepID=A0A6M8MQS8_9PSED|nr:hypothetical protein [Pseudomonas graminis]MDC6383012.1 hypothetical protein [Pseudomonas graminis]QKF52071.1 hypothetical protein FX982_03052 [Pseudomonas graminis]
MSVVKIGKHFRTVMPNGMVQLVAPSENTDGLVIQTASINPASGFVNLYASLTPPASIGDLNTRMIFNGNGNGVSGVNSQVEMPNPLFIPAGMGLWVTSGSWGSTAVTGSLAITWDVVAA